MTVAPVGAPAPALPVAEATPQRPSFGALLEARSASAPTPTAAAPRPAAAALAAVERAQARLDAVLQAARSGRTFSARELLGLQAEAYRTVQTVDLATKLVEQGVQSVKQALNTQL